MIMLPGNYILTEHGAHRTGCSEFANKVVKVLTITESNGAFLADEVICPDGTVLRNLSIGDRGLVGLMPIPAIVETP